MGGQADGRAWVSEEGMCMGVVECEGGLRCCVWSFISERKQMREMNKGTNNNVYTCARNMARGARGYLRSEEVGGQAEGWG